MLANGPRSGPDDLWRGTAESRAARERLRNRQSCSRPGAARGARAAPPTAAGRTTPATTRCCRSRARAGTSRTRSASGTAGFLPTEAEWKYAIAGGDEQRMYPWGTPAPGSDNQYAIESCRAAGSTPGSTRTFCPRTARPCRTTPKRTAATTPSACAAPARSRCSGNRRSSAKVGPWRQLLHR